MTEGHDARPCLLLDQTRPLTLPEGAADAPNLVKFINAKKAGGFVHVDQVVPAQGGRTCNLAFWYKAKGLLRENRDDPKCGFASFMVFVYWLDDHGRRVGGGQDTLWVINQQLDAPDWVPVLNGRAHTGPRPYRAPEGAKAAQIRFQLVTVAPEVAPKVWIDDVSFAYGDANEEAGPAPKQVDLVNADFEAGEGGSPKGWKAVGSGRATWVSDVVHGGRRAACVSDTGPGKFSGWVQDVPAQPAHAYTLNGWVKGGDLVAYGPVAGGALCLQYLDKDGQTLGEPVLSPTVPANTDWNEVQASIAVSPAGAATLRVMLGLQFCKGSAWFDDVRLTVEEQAAARTAILRRPNPASSSGVTYARNLLANGDVEHGTSGRPSGWTYVGKSDTDWTAEQIAAFHRENRPYFGIGRGRGEWSSKIVYSGKGALLNISMDPPLSKNAQWYGRTPVDGFWLSDPMPCTPGKQYYAGAWIRPGFAIAEPMRARLAAFNTGTPLT